MCTAQVLLFADVMRRNDFGRTSDALPPRYICRKLFADDAPAPRPSRADFLGTLQTQMRKEASDRWNFDFQTETPLPGRYQWVPVRRPGTNSAKGPRTEEPSVVVVGETESRTEPDAESAAIRQSSKTNSAASRKSKVVTQSKITDFLLQRKRHRTAELDLTSPKLKFRRINAHLDAQTTSN